MKRFVVLAALLSPLIVAGCSHPNYYPPPPPGAVDDVAARGYHDGFEAARRDVGQPETAGYETSSEFPQSARASAGV